MSLSKSEIIARSVNALKRETLDVPELGVVTVRELTAAEHDRYKFGMFAKDAGGRLVLNERQEPVVDPAQAASARLQLVAFCVIDDNGERIFNDEDVPLIGGMSSDVVDAICKVAARLSGLDKKTPVDDAVKG